MRWRSLRCHDDRGMATVELAVALPVLVLFLVAALTAVALASQRVRAQDAAREAARAAARGDDAAAQRLARQVAPTVRDVSIGRSGTDVVARVTVIAHPLASWLPAVHFTERAVAAAEPDAAESDDARAAPP